MARFQRYIPVLVFVVIVLLGGTATFITEVRGIRAAIASATADVNVSAVEADSAAGTAALMVDVPGLPY